MPDEQIRLDVTATDNASDVLEDVADDAEKLERLSPELEVTADTDQAERGIRDVTDDAEKLERLSPELEVTADTDRAERAVKELGEDVETLSRKDTEILLRAKIDDARGALKALRDDLGQTGEKAEDTARQMDRIGGDGGLKTRGNAIADLTGPLGDASGAASDFAGVFDGIGDIAEDVAGKVGLNAAAMSTAIGGIGIAVAAAAALWTLFTQNQEKARARQRELVEGQERINEAIREGNREAAAAELVDLYDEAFRAADKAGISAQEFTQYLTGLSDNLPSLDARLAALTDRFGEHWDLTRGGIEYKQLADQLAGARDQYDRSNDSLSEQDRRLAAVSDALQGLSTDTDRATSRQERLQRQADRTRDAFDRMRGSLNMESAILRLQEQIGTALTNVQTGAEVTAEDIIDIKQSIIDVAEYAKLSPIEVRSLLERVDQGDYLAVAAEVEELSRRRPVGVATNLDTPQNLVAWRNALQGFFRDNPVTQPVTVAQAGASGAWYGGPR